MKQLVSILFLVAISLASGCASIVSGTDQKLTFNSEPDGATVTVSGRVLGKTPFTVPVDKGKNQSLVFEKEGYKTFTTQLSTTMNAWFFGNIVLGGVIGSTTDGVSGAIHEFSPDQYFVTLTPDTTSGVSSSDVKRVKEIIIAFSSEFRKQLAIGGGELVDTVVSILNVESGVKGSTIDALNQLSLNNDNDLELAEIIIEIYGVR
jgi:hypothetical protein